MKHHYFKKILFVVFVTSFGSAYAANNTANYWLCNNKVFGSWSSFGVYTEACDVDPFADRSELKKTYAPLVIDNKPSSTEVRNYMQEMYSVVRDISSYYLKQRKPSVSAAELKAFQEGIFALAHQESFWSHYRETSSSNLKMIRGDYGHGHGLMQVDDRHHYQPVRSGVGAKLGIHFAYALDIFYEGWQKAPAQSCVSSSTAYLSRTRSAYGIYNGGLGSACRWTNPNHTWYKNDKNYLDKYQKRQWLSYIADINRPASLNISCLSQGHENCPNEFDPPQSGEDLDYENDLFYMNSKGLFCAIEGKQLFCLDQYRDAACLNAKLGRQINDSTSFSSSYKSVPIVVLDRNQLCPNVIPSLFNIGQKIELRKTINLRDTPGGNKVGVVNSNEIFEVLDFEVKNESEQQRYYKVKQGSVEGYIYAGDRADALDWAVSSQSKPDKALLAEVGERVQIVISSGINQRKTPGGSLIQLIPNQEILSVEEVITQGVNNYLYYKVSYRGQSGYIYSGQGYPEQTYPQWVTPTTSQLPQKTAVISSNVYYLALTTCNQTNCSTSDYFVPGPKTPGTAQSKHLKIERVSDTGWAFVNHSASGKSGWLLLKDLRFE